MDRLFDSLSEDWVSQPCSPSSEGARRRSSVGSLSSQLSNASQSRIPRFKSRTSSRLSPNGSKHARSIPSTGSNDSIKRPLREKSSSKLNTFNNRPQRKDSAKLASGSLKTHQAHNTLAARASPTSRPENTVQHNASPRKLQMDHGTPEWKRRLGGNTGSGDQPNLFSPIALQSVFKPPTVKATEKRKKQTSYQSCTIEDLPSSPPTNPTEPGRSVTHTDGVGQKGPRSRDNPGEAADTPKHVTQQGNLASIGDLWSGDKTQEQGFTESTSASTSILPQETEQDTLPDGGRKGLSPKNSRATTSRAIGPEQRRQDPLSLDAPTLSERSRVTSGQTEDCNEGLSPFYVSRQHTVDGRIDYAAVIDMGQFHQQMQDLATGERDRQSSQPSDHDIDYPGANSPGAATSRQCPSSDLTSHSLPEDLSTGTESFMVKGGFVNPRRGGRSREGSFMRKPLSPSSPTSVQIPESPISSIARRNSTGSSSKSLPSTMRKAAPPFTPEAKLANGPSSDHRPRSSGSPLKLFGQYDTYTNDRLARRMSKFEETMPNSLQKDDIDEEGVRGNPVPIPRASSPADGRTVRVSGSEKASRLSSFGDGELDQYLFRSHSLSPRLEGRENGQDSQLPHGLIGQFRFERAAESSADSTLRRKRKNHPSTSLVFQDDTRSILDLRERQNARDRHENETQEVVWTTHGKRLPRSPAKDSPPKRRRTLVESELNIDSVTSPARQGLPKAPINSMIGRKRKDAIYDKHTQIANPDVLASRHILRPRNPTPSQSGQHRRHRVDERGPTGLSGHGRQYQRQHGQYEAEPVVDTPTEKLAEELASLAHNVAQDMPDDVRKPSVTTADFFNEAQQIMQLIRARGRPPSSHISEEPVAEVHDDGYDSKLLESTKDEFSRPPSREGGSLRKAREPAQIDARVVSRLRKFEDEDDIGLALSSSLRSLKIAQSTGYRDTAGLRSAVRKSDAQLESDANTRILRRAAETDEQNESTPTTETNFPIPNVHSQSFGSHSTSGPSTARSIPTNSSRGSRNKAVIAPETVAHLLSDQVAGMTFDHEKQIWVKSRNSSKSESPSQKGSASSEVIDDDILGAIPDLSVDEIEELRRMKAIDYPSKSLASTLDQISNRDHAKSDVRGEYLTANATASNLRPNTANRPRISTEEINFAPTKHSQFASSDPAPETRVTSSGDECAGRKPSGPEYLEQRTPPSPEAEPAEEVEHEISIFDGRVLPTSKPNGYRKPRVVTVAFSSPLIDQIDASYAQQSEPEPFDDDDVSNLENSPGWQKARRRLPSSARSSVINLRRSSAYRNASRRMSTGQQPYIARPLSRLDEHEELSTIQCTGTAAMDVAMSTPLNRQSIALPQTSGQNSNAGFQLSPLPDFTVHQIDRPLDRSLIAYGQALQTLRRPEARTSFSTLEIVKNLTDIEPFEPYWEYLRAMDLHNRGMLTLHMLSDFCARLEELDVSNNKLGEVNGAPSSLRFLNARRNCLSSLSAWGHLQNLQYLNVSGNQLTNLSSFQSLVHLRELKADDNLIENTEGVFQLDGLLKLSLKGNRIRRIDFGTATLPHLINLDLSGNRLNSIFNVDCLPNLKHLDLSNNDLNSFDEALLSHSKNLKALNLSNNRLSSFSVTNLPNLHTLCLDSNFFSEISGLCTHKTLHTLSWRSQKISPSAKIDWQSAYNIITLQLSGNNLTTFAPTTPFLNLQTLELASTGLQNLPSDFGLQCPNVRVLNLNYNALRDLQPLLGIVRLHKLCLAGNRISRLRRTATVLQHLSVGLLEVDMRSNPLTVGFYIPQRAVSVGGHIEKQLVLSSASHFQHVEDSDEDEPTKAADAYLLPALNRENDRLSSERLDEDTKLRRRVYEMLLLGTCKELRVLDGLQVERKDVGRRDQVLGRLKELGILRSRAGVKDDDSESDYE